MGATTLHTPHGASQPPRSAPRAAPTSPAHAACRGHVSVGVGVCAFGHARTLMTFLAPYSAACRRQRSSSELSVSASAFTFPTPLLAARAMPTASKGHPSAPTRNSSTSPCSTWTNSSVGSS